MKAHISDKQPITKERLLKMMAQAVRINKDLWFIEGEKVRLKTKQIIERKDWATKNKKYKDFVTSNHDTVFTVHFEEKYAKSHTIACLNEDTTDPKWLFWVGDFERVQDGKDT
jgi:hypothetical protein